MPYGIKIRQARQWGMQGGSSCLYFPCHPLSCLREGNSLHYKRSNRITML